MKKLISKRLKHDFFVLDLKIITVFLFQIKRDIREFFENHV